MLFIPFVLFSVAIVLAYLLKSERETRVVAQAENARLERKLQALEERYSPIPDVDDYVANARATIEAEQARIRQTIAEEESRSRDSINREIEQGRIALASEVADARATMELTRAAMLSQVAELEAGAATLRSNYQVAHERYQELSSEVAGLEEHFELLSVGLYEPHFTFEDSESYKATIKGLRDQQREYVKAGLAVTCNTTWLVGSSEAEGRRMVSQYQKVMLRSFNAESDAAIANVTWNNYTTMATRIRKAFDALNKLGTRMSISLTPSYRDMRLQELQLVYEAAERKQQEREAARRLRAEEREEERVQRELERAREEAAKDESRYEKALLKARNEFEHALENEREAMQSRIAELEADVAEAHERKERAIAQAQLTRAGHVYVISNLGAFGERVVKIGLTRRLEPEERIKELGDASVPFPFDLHALLYSEDAPALEAQLHNKFWEHRVNWANDRKEFFRVSLADVQAALAELSLQTSWRDVAEAREYRETMALLEKATLASALPATTQHRFAADPFDVETAPIPS